MRTTATITGPQVIAAAAMSAILMWGVGCHDCAHTLTCPSTGGASGTSTSGDAGAAGSGGASGSGGAVDSYVCPDDPSDGDVREECGIWVSSTHGDDHNAGSQAAPVKTIGAAINRVSSKQATRIFACGETYTEAVALPAGISLFGGFFGCEGDGEWLYADDAARATILGPPDVPALTLLEGKDESLLAELVIVAADATEPGGSSVAVFAKDLANAELRRTDVFAGNGKDGADGEPGNHFSLQAKSGLSGLDGADSCSMSPGMGGPSVILQCEDGLLTKGGEGGLGGNAAGGSGSEGFQPPDPNGQGYGAGGQGESAAPGSACMPGIGGAQGEQGEDGIGTLYDTSTNGRITPDGYYIGVAGTDGKPGKPGQGGGGGGGSRGNQNVCSGLPPGGAGGGSGGTGGCGGRPGKGGQAGGSSFGMVVRGDRITVHETVRVHAGNGGKGGNGGALQQGGVGGLPGQGGMGFGGLNGVKTGCAGGVGGHGGNGGNGGGGRGGHSVGIVTAGDASVLDLKSKKSVGKAGPGGGGGGAGMNAGQGGPGAAAPTLILEK